MSERITDAELQRWEAEARNPYEHGGEFDLRVYAEIRRLRVLVTEAGSLQAVNREREARGFEIVYSTRIDAEARAIRDEQPPKG